MTRKHKIELAVLSGLFVVVLSGLFWVYQSHPRAEQDQFSPEELLLEEMAWSQATDYRIQSAQTGIEIHHQPTQFRITFSSDWSAEIIPAQNSSEEDRIEIRLKESTLGPNNIIQQGCSVEIRFAHAPLRQHLAREAIESLGRETLEGIWREEVIPVGPGYGISRSSIAQNGYYFADITAPLNSSYLLDASIIFSTDHQKECQKQLRQFLAAAQIN